MKGREPGFVSCTPLGCMELLKRYSVPLAGRRAVVIGRSSIVGIPMAALLTKADATVTIVHSRTHDIAQHTREADIVVAAVGQPLMVKGDWIKEGAVVIDVGINSVPDATRKAGYRLVGDVDYASCLPRARLITPVPGGVGPMTVAMLLSNTLRAARRLIK
jgi:5,10-methylene-tetrahydrofolate dehydrogenase/methenyl tetrahydrofolate cyclohydrolase